MNEKIALGHISAQLKDINKNLSSISRSLYLISKINAKEKESPYKDMPELKPEDCVGKFVCYHEEDDNLYFYDNGVFIKKVDFEVYQRECYKSGKIYEAGLHRVDYKKR